MSQGDSSSNQQRWQRVRTIFSGALERPVAERKAFVAGVCADDPSLHAEVEKLLRAHDTGNTGTVYSYHLRGRAAKRFSKWRPDSLGIRLLP